MDLDMMQMMALGGSQAGDLMAAKISGLPHVNPTNYMTGYEQRSALRQALHPRVSGGRMARMVSGSMGMPSVGGGMDPSSVTDPSVANNALQPYGLQLPTHTNPFLFFNDQNQDGSPTWAGNHPKVAKAIEGAMIGATTPGGVTTGESISNVAKTVLGMPGMYKNSQAAQMQAPFDMASQINGLQKDQADMQVKLAQAYHMYATGSAALDKPVKNYGGQVYQDSKNRPYQINTVTGAAEALDGKSDPLELTGSTKIGTPKSADSNSYPKGVSTVGEKAAWNEYKANGFEGDPRTDKNWNNRVMAWQGKNAAVTGFSGAAARGAGNQAAGGVSQADDKALKAAEDDAKVKESAAKEKLKPSAFADAKDPLAAMNAETQRRQAEAKAARQKFNDMSANVSSQQPSSKTGGVRRKTIIHPNGAVEIQ